MDCYKQISSGILNLTFMKDYSAQFIEGTTYLRQHQFTKARHVFLDGVKNNNPLCAIGLWYMSLDGSDRSNRVSFTDEQYNNTIDRLTILAEQENNPEAYYVLGKLYYYGNFGLSANRKKGEKYLRKAAELGNEFAEDFVELILTKLSHEGFYSSFIDPDYSLDKNKFIKLIDEFDAYVESLSDDDINEATFNTVKTKYIEISILQTKLNDFCRLVDTYKPGNIKANEEMNFLYLKSVSPEKLFTRFLAKYVEKGYTLDKNDNLFGTYQDKLNSYKSKTMLSYYSYSRRIAANNCNSAMDRMFKAHNKRIYNSINRMRNGAKNENDFNAINNIASETSDAFSYLKNDVFVDYSIHSLELNKKIEYALSGNIPNGPLLKALKDIGFDYASYNSLCKAFADFLPEINRYLERKRALISNDDSYQRVYYSYVPVIPASTMYLSTRQIKKYAIDICSTVSKEMADIVTHYFDTHKATFVRDTSASNEGTGGVTTYFFAHATNRVAVYDWPDKGCLYTTVHEFGHVYHNYRNKETENSFDMLNKIADRYHTSPLVETFSQFMEIVGHTYMLKNNPIKEDPLFLLDDYLSCVVGKMIGFYRGMHIENRLYWMIENKIPFTRSSLLKTIYDAEKEVGVYYGESSLINKMYSLFSNDNYYSIRYFVGIVIALLMAKKLEEEGEDYQANIEAVIALPNEANFADLIKLSKINLKDQKNIRSIFNGFKKQIYSFIEQTEPMLDKKLLGRKWSA